MRLLIVKTSALGDVIQSFPVIEALKGTLPDLQIDWIVEKPCALLVRAHPLVTHTHLIDTHRWRSEWHSSQTWHEIKEVYQTLRQVAYDVVLDLQGNSKSALVTLCARSKCKIGFDRREVAEWPNLLATHRHLSIPKGISVRERYLALARHLFPTLQQSSTPYWLRLTPQEEGMRHTLYQSLETHRELKLLVCPGSRWPNKQLSEECWASFLAEASRRLHVQFFLLWHNEAEHHLAKRLSCVAPRQTHLLGDISLPLLQHVMRKMDLVCAVDSLPLHLAGTTPTPTYGIFGPSSAALYQPLGPLHHAIQGSCSYGEIFQLRCRQLRRCRTGNCLKSLEGTALFWDLYRQHASLLSPYRKQAEIEQDEVLTLREMATDKVKNPLPVI